MSFRLLAAAALATTALAATAMPAAAVTVPSQLVVFGDSLVDAGNITLAVGSDKFNPVAKGYYPGRFTNGLDYTDLLSQRLYGTVSTPSLAGGTNFAFGGAEILTTTGNTVPNLAQQIGAYFAGTANKADANALYILNAGGNDIFAVEAALKAGSITQAQANAYGVTVANALAADVQSLLDAGAKRILVTGIPNVDPLGFTYQGFETTALAGLTLGNAQLLQFDYQGFFTAISTNPGAFGVAPFTKTGNCIDQNVSNGVIDCTGYFSFDGTHPTAAVQTALYNQVVRLTGLDAVPEPATWALMIVGFALVGTQLRRRAVLAA